MSDSRQKEFVCLLTESKMALRCFSLLMLQACADAAGIVRDAHVVLWKKMDTCGPGTNFRPGLLRWLGIKCWDTAT
jgi:hypothetical protein